MTINYDLCPQLFRLTIPEPKEYPTTTKRPAETEEATGKTADPASTEQRDLTDHGLLKLLGRSQLNKIPTPPTPCFADRSITQDVMVGVAIAICSLLLLLPTI